MKTNNRLQKLAMAGALLLCLILPSLSKAQISYPYYIKNGTSCDVEIGFKIFDNNCNFVCNNSNLLIPAGTAVAINCGTSTTDEFYFVVNWIDNNLCTATQSQLGGSSSLCYASSTTVTATSACTNCSTITLTVLSNVMYIN